MTSSKGIKKANVGIEAYFIMSCDHSQPSMNACMQSQERWYDTNMKIALWFSNSCISIYVVKSPFYQIVISKIETMGHDIRIILIILYM